METQKLKIQGPVFEIPAPFTEGHVCDANEAATLNQTFAENIRNNQAKKVQAELDKAKAEGREPDLASLQSGVSEYANSYKFGAKRTGGGGGDSSLPKDPVERQAHILVREVIRNAAKKRNVKMTAEQIAGMVPGLLAKKPEYMEEARRRVEAANNISIEELELPAEIAPAGEGEASASTESGGESGGEANAPTDQAGTDQSTTEGAGETRSRRKR